MDLEQKFNWKIQKLERACARPETSPEERLQLAEVYFQKGYYLGKGDPWFDLALDQVAHLLHGAEPPTVSQALTLRGNALCGKGDWDDAEVAYRQALEFDKSNALAFVGLGNLEKRRADYRRARDFFTRATEIEPDLWQAHYNLGRAAHEEAQARDLQGVDELLDKAIYHLIATLRLDPMETFIPNIYRELGELFLYTRRYEDAKKFFTRLTRHERYAPLAWYYLGLTNYSLGKYKSSIQCYRSFLKHEPDNAMALAKIALAHLELGESPRALEAAQQALDLDPGNVLALFTMGCAFLDQGAHPTAEAHFEQALGIDPHYFPAFSELARSHFDAKDTAWLFERLAAEIDAFEETPGFEGGRRCYVGPRGAHRRRIDILLGQLRPLGEPIFAPLHRLLDRCQTDSLRFQLWEEIHDLCLQARIQAVSQALSEAPIAFSRELGQETLRLAQYLPTQLLIEASTAEPEQLRRAALERLERRDDIAEYKRAIGQAEGDHRAFRGTLLRALATKGTKEAEAFLSDALEAEDPQLRLSAAVALVFYGHEEAIKVLEAEAEALDGPASQALRALIRTGWERHGERHKIIHLTDLYGGGRPQTPLSLAPSPPRGAPAGRGRGRAHQCAVCHKDQREVDRMLAGSQLMICTACVEKTWKRRGELRTGDADARCSFCRRSLLEVDSLYAPAVGSQAEPVYMCDRCMDLSNGVIRREEVERFLRDFH